MIFNPWHRTGDAGRLAFNLALVSCYVLSALGGVLHIALYHSAPHGETVCAADAGPSVGTDCDDEHHGSTSKTCSVCVSLARSVGANPIVVTVFVPASADAPDLPLASPAITKPFRPHAQRGPPVQV